MIKIHLIIWIVRLAVSTSLQFNMLKGDKDASFQNVYEQRIIQKIIYSSQIVIGDLLYYESSDLQCFLMLRAICAVKDLAEEVDKYSCEINGSPLPPHKRLVFLLKQKYVLDAYPVEEFLPILFSRCNFSDWLVDDSTRRKCLYLRLEYDSHFPCWSNSLPEYQCNDSGYEIALLDKFHFINAFAASLFILILYGCISNVRQRMQNFRGYYQYFIWWDNVGHYKCKMLKKCLVSS